MVSDPIQFGPEEFTFAQPVQLSFPVSADTTQAYMLGRLDRNSNTWMIVPTLIDPDDPNRVYAHASHLSV